jgi:hypothetical protein
MYTYKLITDLWPRTKFNMILHYNIHRSKTLTEYFVTVFHLKLNIKEAQ